MKLLNLFKIRCDRCNKIFVTHPDCLDHAISIYNHAVFVIWCNICLDKHDDKINKVRTKRLREHLIKTYKKNILKNFKPGIK